MSENHLVFSINLKCQTSTVLLKRTAASVGEKYDVENMTRNLVSFSSYQSSSLLE